MGDPDVDIESSSSTDGDQLKDVNLTTKASPQVSKLWFLKIEDLPKSPSIYHL